MIHLIVQTAPPRPACFADDAEWRAWLVLAHESGLKVVRRVDVGKTRNARDTFHQILPREQIDYCCDCTSIHRRRMEAAGRCQPSAAAISRDFQES